MQTFLPLPTFQASLACLDNKRLGKQRVEARQILDALVVGASGWRAHPAVRMWEDYIGALSVYHNLAIEQWTLRGFRNTMQRLAEPNVLVMPPWYNEEFMRSHRSNLLRKFPEWYGRFGWTEPTNLEYVWPTSSR